MNPLEKHIIEQIGETSPLSIAQYMALALGHEEHGYYMNRDPFGADGDFITAPEISQMFGELIGLWVAVVWQGMGSPTEINLVELGPGRGTLMADMLRATMAAPGFGEAVRVHMVETSPALKTQQQQALDGLDLAHDAAWHGAFDDVPEGPMMLIANEFFDALPIEQYFRAGDYWCPRVVDVKPDGDGLCYVLLPPYDALELPPGLIDAPPDSVVEVCPAGLDLIEKISRRITAQGGVALIIDYGHGASGAGNTLQAVRDHQSHHPLIDPGEADLTAHVDFGALGQRIFASGARALGVVNQGTFLQRLGIRERAQTLSAGASPEQVEDITEALKRLTDGEEMGDLFKVMAISSIDG
ncbi:MAG TPA: class I SAM-dependent methyltransferase, partial [Rhodospirillales bacterium]|nr:class I SAM-dependent methyltransferase [Rhodospirillales bacterium]